MALFPNSLVKKRNSLLAVVGFVHVAKATPFRVTLRSALSGEDLCSLPVRFAEFEELIENIKSTPFKPMTELYAYSESVKLHEEIFIIACSFYFFDLAKNYFYRPTHVLIISLK